MMQHSPKIILDEASRPKARDSEVQLKVKGDLDQVGAMMQSLSAADSPVEITFEWKPLNGKSSRQPGQPYARRLQVNRSGGRIRYLKVEEVNWIEAANQYVRLHLKNRAYLVRDSISGLASRLDPAHFQRIHRSTIVNLNLVEELLVESSTHYWVVLSGGRRLPVSQPRREPIKSALIGR